MPKITPGQGLLLLIEYYQGDSHKQNQLKKMYLSGAKNYPYSTAIYTALLEEPLLMGYNIVVDGASISDDPSRRYFETHLAYQTLKHQLHTVDVGSIYELLRSSHDLIDFNKINDKFLQTINNVFNGENYRPSFHKKENFQYLFYIQKLKNGSVFSKFSELHREKIKWIERVVYIALVNGWGSTKLPIDIYTTERFRDRGKICQIDDQCTTRNQNFGLLKGHMPLSTEDIAFSETPFMHMKSSDYSTFDSFSNTVQNCFIQLVHPFSNSISGSFLLQLRVLAGLHNYKPSIFTENLEAFTNWIRLTISSTLYYSGGHSLYEYNAVLKDPEVQEFFQYMPQFSELDLEKIFYVGNEAAFEEALDATIDYNRNLLQKKELHRSIRAYKNTFFGSAIPTCDPTLEPSPIGVDDSHNP